MSCDTVIAGHLERGGDEGRRDSFRVDEGL